MIVLNVKILQKNDAKVINIFYAFSFVEIRICLNKKILNKSLNFTECLLCPEYYCNFIYIFYINFFTCIMGMK